MDTAQASLASIFAKHLREKIAESGELNKKHIMEAGVSSRLFCAMKKGKVDGVQFSSVARAAIATGVSLDKVLEEWQANLKK